MKSDLITYFFISFIRTPPCSITHIITLNYFNTPRMATINLVAIFFITKYKINFKNTYINYMNTKRGERE